MVARLDVGAKGALVSFTMTASGPAGAAGLCGAPQGRRRLRPTPSLSSPRLGRCRARLNGALQLSKGWRRFSVEAIPAPPAKAVIARSPGRWKDSAGHRENCMIHYLLRFSCGAATRPARERLPVRDSAWSNKRRWRCSRVMVTSVFPNARRASLDRGQLDRCDCQRCQRMWTAACGRCCRLRRPGMHPWWPSRSRMSRHPT